MKKLMIAILVMAAASVFAQEATQLDGVTFENNMFTVNKDGKMLIQLYQPGTTLGHEETFGYIVTSANGETFSQILADYDKDSEYPKFTGEMKFEIPNLKASDTVVFFVKPKEGADNLTEFVEYKDENDNPKYYGITYDIGNHHQNHGIAFIQTSFVEKSAPSGQPLPGALTTMLVAGGCAALLRKRKAARK